MNKYKFMKLASQFLFVIIVIICVFVLLLNFNIISLNSSDLPLAILLNQNEMGLKVGSTYQLEASVFPKGIYHGKVVWSSSDESVAKVNEVTGYVETFKPGEVLIKASVPLNNLEVDCKISVSKEDVLIKNIQINNDKINLAVGGSYTIDYMVSPINTTMHNFDFVSSDTSVAMVNKNGVIKAVGNGTAVVTMKSKISDVKDTVLINVYRYSETANNTNYIANNGTYADEYIYSKTKSISLSNDRVELEIGAKTKLTSLVLPSNANQNVNWSSSNNKIVSVDSNGVITGLQEGSTSVVATSIDGVSSVCQVTVKKQVTTEESIDISESVLNLEIGQTKKVDYQLYLLNVGGNSLEWVSSNTQIASVSNGVITGLKEGTCLIKAVSSSALYSDYVTVNVSKPDSVINLDNLSFENTNYMAKVNDTITLKPVLSPNNATNRFLNWTTSNSQIATVSNGIVNCKKEGTVTITASNGSLSTTVKIVIKNINPSLITIENNENINLDVGDTRYLVKKIVPSNATNQEVIWSSSNKKIVSVNSSGLITAKGRGTATITVKTINGKSDKITISVS